MNTCDVSTLGQKMQVVFVTLTAELAVCTDLTLALRLWQCHDGGTRGAHAAAAREEDARSAARAGVGGKGGTGGGRDSRERSQCLQFSSFKSTHTLFKRQVSV